MSMSAPAYPITVEVDDAAPQGRLGVFFRILLVIPHLIVLVLLGVVTSLITFVAWFTILLTGGYPEGMMNFVINVSHWSTRVSGYMFLLTGTYPPFAMGPDDSYPVRLIAQGETEGRNRLTTFFRIFMLIPQVIVLYFVQIALEVVGLIAWFAALFTGRVPGGLHSFLAGGLRWQTRVNLYGSLITDKYPPFGLN